MEYDNDDGFNRLKELLKDMFKINYESDLDFGIYRIMKFKRKQIENFIENNLKSIDNEKIKDLNLDQVAFKKEIYNDIYEFFSRYYDNGDFIPQSRFGGKTKYYIPYNGQEVYFYWATHGEYYVKTTDYFTNYEFDAYLAIDKSYQWKVRFNLKDAELEKNYVKDSDKKYFILDNEQPINVDLDNRILDINFNFRSLTNEESERYKSNRVQDEINRESFELIKNKLDSNKDLDKLNKILSSVKVGSKEDDKTEQLLYRRIDNYTKRNSRDYFIHKNLKQFLLNELGFYIKEEIIDLNNIKDSESIKNEIAKKDIIYDISSQIIEFLAQIEDFQKALWEKKKFVYNVNYVITLDRIFDKGGIELIKRIFDNESIEGQIKEWKDLGIIEGKFNKNSVFTKNLNGEILNEKYKFLPIDTKYFKDLELSIISLFDDLDESLDGWLIHSENYQALNTILPKFKEKVQTIYIDPPYNTGSDEFIYKDKYKDSSWLTMLENRIGLAKNLMKDKGNIFVSIGNNGDKNYESYNLGILMSLLSFKRFGDLIWKKRSNKGNLSEIDLTELHEYILSFGNETSHILKNIISAKEIKEYKRDVDGTLIKWQNISSTSQHTKDTRPNLYYGIVYNIKEDKLIFNRDEIINKKDEIKIIPSQDGKTVYPMVKDKMEEYYKEGLLKVFKEKDKYVIKIKKKMFLENGDINGNILKSIISDNKVGYKIKGTSEATKEYRNLFGRGRFQTQKPVNLIRLLVQTTTSKDDIILDFFAGSGTTAHAVMKLNNKRYYLGKRKFILVEMADYFNTLIIPRIKKVAYSFNWKDGKPQDNNGIGVFFKYFDLEQYEDSLNNIEFDNKEEYNKLSDKEDYLIKYMLDYETKYSMVKLNTDILNDPFNFKMKIYNSKSSKEVSIDLIETFNLVYGIQVKRIIKKTFKNSDYIFVYGFKNDLSGDIENLLVVWRCLNNIDLKEDSDFIKNIVNEEKIGNIDLLLTNGDNILGSDFKSNSLNPIFYKLLNSGVYNE